ncbi:integrase core domain-containing protein [[Roseibacterium] beibuensis]|uniref:integrase core domain-containing protein n=1 Tax=[Roseibacterium] beibuensis TaxID=1193142 RepID=UPI003CD0B41B
MGPRTHAHAEIGRWRSHYNTKRPHSALGYLSPTEFLIKTTTPALETLAVSTLPAQHPNPTGRVWTNQAPIAGDGQSAAGVADTFSMTLAAAAVLALMTFGLVLYSQVHRSAEATDRI